jgi:hypothetical protein
MSEGIYGLVKNIRIKGGIHESNGIEEKQIENLVADLATAIKKNVRTDSYITVEFTKTIGTKVNS